MRLFQILTRRLVTGKIKVRQKLLKRLRRETGWKHHPKPHRENHRFSRLLCASFAAVVTLSILLVGGRSVKAAAPGSTASAISGYSAAGLFNQANAYARSDKAGLAILDYERAQLLAPNDADIAANLHFIRAKAGLPDASGNWLTRSLSRVPPNTFAWLGSLCLALVGISLLLIRFHPRRRWAFRSLTGAASLLVAAAIGSAIMTWPKLKQAVVIAHEAPVLTAPVLAAEPLFKLREGETVTVQAEHHEFSLVRISTGRSGWVPRADLALVVPKRLPLDVRSPGVVPHASKPSNSQS